MEMCRGLVSLLLFVILSVSVDSVQGFLRVVSQNKIEGPSGNAVKLKGFNLDGWLMYEDSLYYTFTYKWPVDVPNEKTIRHYLDTSTANPNTGDKFFNGIRNTFIAEADIQKIAELGGNLLRIPVAHWLFDTANSTGYHHINNVIEWAAARAMYIIIALKAAPGCQNTSPDCDESETANLFTDEPSKVATIEFWRALAGRYANDSTVIGYDLLDEPEAPDDNSLEDMYRRIIPAIRAVDSNHIIFVQGNNKGTDFTVFKNRWLLSADGNAAYSIHILHDASMCPFLTNYRDSIDKFFLLPAEYVQDDNLPIFIGSYMANCANYLSAAISAFQDNANFQPTAYWTFKGLPEDEEDNFYPYIQDDRKPWENMLRRLTENAFLTEGEWTAGFDALKFSNFKARDEHVNYLSDYFNGREVTYIYTDLWIILAIVGGCVLIAAAGQFNIFSSIDWIAVAGVGIYMYRKKKKELWFM